MITAKIKPFNITRGNTYQEPLIITTYNNDDNEIPVTLTGYTITMDIRNGVTNKSPLLYSCSTGDGSIFTEGDVHNIIVINIQPEETIKWKGGKYYRDIKFEKDGEVYTYLEGIIQVRENIT